MTLMPPAVEPAEPPTKLAKMSSTGIAVGHAEKSAVVKPVVVAIDTAWNSPLMMASVGALKVLKYSSAETTSTDMTTRTKV